MTRDLVVLDALRSVRLEAKVANVISLRSCGLGQATPREGPIGVDLPNECEGRRQVCSSGGAALVAAVLGLVDRGVVQMSLAFRADFVLQRGRAISWPQEVAHRALLRPCD
jgi:hypothetical protein